VQRWTASPRICSGEKALVGGRERDVARPYALEILRAVAPRPRAVVPRPGAVAPRPNVMDIRWRRRVAEKCHYHHRHRHRNESG
jgi:hypothetical protein